MRGVVYVFILSLFLYSCHKEEVILSEDITKGLEHSFLLKINDKHCSLDFASSTLRYSISSDELKGFSGKVSFNANSSLSINGAQVNNNTIHNFGNLSLLDTIQLVFKRNNIEHQLKLTFTNLAIAQIITGNRIYNEFKTMARLYYSEHEENKHTNNFLISVEYRGATTLKSPKRPYSFSLKNENQFYFLDELKHPLLDDRKLSDYTLDAVYHDKSAFRNKIAFQIWNKISRTKDDTMTIKFCELYINNEHHGVYNIGQQFSANFFEFNDPKSFLYKAADIDGKHSTYHAYTNSPPKNFKWDGWEQKYPDPSISVNWQPLDELRQLVVNGTNAAFIAEIENLVDLENLIDYYLFLNVVSASDNTAKNYFLKSTKQKNKIMILPWDLDGSFGRGWDGSISTVEPDKFLSINLYKRLFELNPNDFLIKTKNRWNELRSSDLSTNSLLNLINSNTSEVTAGNIIKIENNRWDKTLDIETEKSFITSWGIAHWEKLDLYFNNLN